MSLPPEFLANFDKAFVVVNDSIISERTKRMQEFHFEMVRKGLHISSACNKAAKEIHFQLFREFGDELLLKIKRLIHSEIIHDVNFQQAVKEYIINRRIHDYFIGERQSPLIKNLDATTQWFDAYYRLVRNKIDDDITAMIIELKRTYPLPVAKSLTTDEPKIEIKIAGDGNTVLAGKEIKQSKTHPKSDKTNKSLLFWTKIAGILTCVGVAYVIYDHLPKGSDNISTSRATNNSPVIPAIVPDATKSPKKMPVINSPQVFPAVDNSIHQSANDNNAPVTQIANSTNVSVNFGPQPTIVEERAFSLNVAKDDYFTSTIFVKVLNPAHPDQFHIHCPLVTRQPDIQIYRDEIQIGGGAGTYRSYTITLETSQKLNETNYSIEIVK